MTYFVDLTPYQYFRSQQPAVNVGWLDAGQSFVTWSDYAEIADFAVALAMWCANLKAHRMQTRGWHVCPLCSDHVLTKPHGSAEIRVVGRERDYAAPTLISHYVLMHQYRPPQEFIDAVLESPYGDLARQTQREDS